ncbi:MAG: hypothetical protein JWM86_2166 [Thermoleophilia bacterium]|nr:hypothetical protein [Thermoleophilia bacterium]
MAASILVAAVLGAGGAHGATSSTVVSADVPSATSLSTLGCPPNSAGVTDFGIVVPGTVTQTTADCTVTFGSSNDTASLRVTQADGTGSAMSHPTDAWTRHTGSSTRFSGVDSSGSTVWILGTTGVGVRRSQDSGATWGAAQTLSGAANTTAISVPSTSVAWASGDGTGSVWRTIDGNVGTPTWNQTTQPSGIAVRGIIATGANTAWVVGDAGAIRRTTDGGATAWTSQTWTDAAGGPGPAVTNLTGIDASDADSFVAFGSGGRVLATTDAGVNWRDISIGSSPSIIDVAIISDNVMVAVGYSGQIFQTSNATNATPTWTLRSTGIDSALEAVEVMDATNVVAVGHDGAVVRSSDAGVSWTADDADSSFMLADVTAVSASTLVAVGSGQNAKRSTNSGAAWTYVIDGANHYNDVSMTTEGVGWRVGSDGVIEKTANGGIAWTAQTSGTTADLFGVYAWSSLRAAAVGRWGTVMTTSNGGATWSARASGVTTILDEVDGVDTGSGWAVGPNGTILRTSDYGVSWTTQQTASGVILHDVFAISGTTAITTGASGAAYRTSDGVAWSNVVLPSGTSAVQALTGDRRSGTAFLVAATNVYRSVDNGATWQLRGVFGTTPSALEAASDTRLIIGQSGSSSYLSTDAGATWSAMSSGATSTHWVYAIDSVDRTTAVVVGDGALSGTTGSSSDIDNYVQNTSDWVADGTEAFGMCLRATTATPTWTPNATCDQTADGPHWKGVPVLTDPTAEVARTALNDGVRSASFRFGLRLSPSEPPGELSAGILFLVIAPAI